MMENDRYRLPDYALLPKQEREEALYAIEKACPDFRLLRFESFGQFGRQFDTAVYGYGGSEFVFVPGATVTLGWDCLEADMDKDTLQALKEGYAASGVTDIEAALREVMSPVREADIPPMLVERFANDVAWRKVPTDDPRLEEYREDIDAVAQGIMMSMLESETFKVEKKGGVVMAYLFDEGIKIQDLPGTLAAQGFSLPTEDEWEYLLAAGARTLFRWGDSLDYCMKLPYRIGYRQWPISLEEPNQFGLVMACDPYMLEVCDGSENFLKGGDGGIARDNGFSETLTYLPIATHYRIPPSCLDYLIAEEQALYRRIIRL